MKHYIGIHHQHKSVERNTILDYRIIWIHTRHLLRQVLFHAITEVKPHGKHEQGYHR